MDSTLKAKADIFLKLHPRQYLEKFYSEGIRPDGREFKICRSTAITQSTVDSAEGSATVKLGSTIMVAGIKLEIAEPATSTPDKGFLVVNVEVGAICGSKFKPGPPGDLAMVLSDQLHQILVNSDLIDLTKLCIQAGVAAYCIYLDVVCIAFGGNLFDASLLAAVAALNSLKLPKAKILEDEGVVQCDPDSTTYSHFLNEEEKLNIYPLSFAIFDSDKVMADPLTEEEDTCSASLSLVVKANSEQLVYTKKVGSTHLNLDTLKNCTELAFQRANFLQSILNK